LERAVSFSLDSGTSRLSITNRDVGLSPASHLGLGIDSTVRNLLARAG